MGGTMAEGVGPVGSVCLGMADAHRAADDDGEPILIIWDGETAIEMSPGLAADRSAAVRGAQRLAAALLRFAADIGAAEEGRSEEGRSGGS